MASNPLIISWNNFTGGVNDQKFQGQAGRYYLGYGVDTQRYDVRPTSSPNVIYTYPNNVTAIFNLEKVNGSTSNIVWSGGEIYNDSTLRHTLTQGRQGENIGFMKPIGASDFKLYYFHKINSTINPKYIHRSNTDGTGFEQSYRNYTMSTGNPYYEPPAGMIVISEGNRIIFSNYNTIWEISNSEVVKKLIDLPENENVVGITKFQGQYKIYTTTAFSTSKMYIWDGGSEIPEISLNLNGMAIFSVANNGAYDYVLADKNLYMFAGVQYQELYRGIGGKILGTIDNYIYIEFTQGDKRVIGRYGTSPGYGNALTPIQIINTINQKTGISAMDYNSNGLLFASNSKLYRTFGAPEAGAIVPFIESLVFVGDSIAFLKELNEIRVKFSGFTTQNIIVYCQIQESGTWIKLFEGNNTTISSINHGLKISKNKFLNPIGNFNTIRFRVEFPHNGQAQGRFYGIDVFGNQDIGV